MIDRAQLTRAAAARGAGMRAAADRPRSRSGIARAALSRVEVLRAEADQPASGFVGYASVTEAPYDMWDMFGEYRETVSAGAFAATLAASPQVELVVNHGRGGQIPLAHTRNGTLRLSEDTEGLRVEADIDPTRYDAHDVLAAVERGDLAEMSFRFMIDSGRWSPDWTEFRIDAVDLDRGDVSIVNFGANPHTHIDSPARSDAAAGELARTEPSAAQALGGDEPAEQPPTHIEEQETPMPESVELAAPSAEPTYEELSARVAQLTEDAQVRANADRANQHRTYEQSVRVGAEARTYSPESDPRGGMFLRDFASAQLGDFDARDRIARHAREERVERAHQSQRDVGTGAFAGLTIPQYLVDLVAPSVRAARPLADNCRRLTLPSDGMTVTISRITTGTSAAVQTAEAAGVSETDIDDTALTVNVRTIAGQQDVSFQALARSVGTEEIILRDLVSAYHTALDSQIINGDGNSGAHLGIRSTTSVSTATLTDSSPTPSEAIGSLYEIQSTIEAATFKVPTHLVMAPRRWHWFRAAVGSDVMLIGQGTAYPPQPGDANNGSPYGPGVRGDLAGLPVIVDGNIPLTVSSTQDVILCVNTDELFLWEESGAPVYLRADQPGAGNLMSKLVVYGYSAFTAGRYPAAQGVVSGSGLAAPSAYGKTVS